MTAQVVRGARAISLLKQAAAQKHRRGGVFSYQTARDTQREPATLIVTALGAIVSERNFPRAISDFRLTGIVVKHLNAKKSKKLSHVRSVSRGSFRTRSTRSRKMDHDILINVTPQIYRTKSRRRVKMKSELPMMKSRREIFAHEREEPLETFLRDNEKFLLI